jgi:hypothetical protein
MYDTRMKTLEDLLSFARSDVVSVQAQLTQEQGALVAERAAWQTERETLQRDLDAARRAPVSVSPTLR